MSAWATKRKIVGFGIIGFFLLSLFLIFVVPNLKVQPTCFDGMQNGNEAGIDCGGSCSLYCQALTVPLVTTWARSFEVIPGRYNALALIENQNTGTAIQSIAYEFKLYDSNNIFIGRRTGRTHILSNNKTAIFAPGISTGDRVPVRTDFSFIENPVWLQTPKGVEQGLTIPVTNTLIEDPFTKPSLTATITNNSRFTLRDFDVVAILYNAENNVITASSTFVEYLAEGQTYDLFFTWQKPFLEEPVRIEILPQINVFQLYAYRSL